MKIFISSLISGFEPFRAAARAAVETLRHQPIRAEDFGALPTTPQIACLRGVRDADVVVLILGDRYGSVQENSGVSTTHEEYLEARDSKPILMFVQEGVERDQKQREFVAEAQGWQGGSFRAGFNSPEELRDGVIRALHELELSNAVGPVDVTALSNLAQAMVSRSPRGRATGSSNLVIAVVGDPVQQLLRPSAIEEPALAEDLNRNALFGPQRIFDQSKGMKSGIEGAALFLEQDRGARIQIDERGHMLFCLPLERPDLRTRSGFGAIAIIQEDVMRSLGAAIGYTDWVWERVDATQRLTHVAIAASVEASDFMGWRSQAEQDASPNSGSLHMAAPERSPVCVDRPRAALRYQASALAEDLMVALRRQWKRV